MVGLGFMELILVVMISAGGQFGDVVTFLEPEDYFRSRNIEVTIATMVQQARREPVSGKEQIGQLLALQYLAGQPEKLKKDNAYALHRQTLEKIAAGTLAKDPQGFSAHYAQRVLRRLDGKPEPQAEKRPLVDGLTWFPDSAEFVACADVRNFTAISDNKLVNLRASMFKKIPQREKDKFYSAVESIGNMHLNRVSVGLEEKDRNLRGLIRFTGKLNRDWVIAKFQNELGEKIKIEDLEGADKVTIVSFVNDRDGAFAFFGDDEVLMAVGRSDNLSRLKGALKVRSSKTGSVTAGKLKSQLDGVSAKAAAMFAGKVPEEMIREFRQPRGALTSFPQSVVGQILHGPQGFDLEVKGELENADQGKEFVATVSKLRTAGLEMIKQLRGKPGLPPQFPLASLEKLMDSIQIEGQGPQMTYRMHVSNELLQVLPEWFLLQDGPDEAPPKKKVEDR